jgi:hypothetical protein
MGLTHAARDYSSFSSRNSVLPHIRCSLAGCGAGTTGEVQSRAVLVLEGLNFERFSLENIVSSGLSDGRRGRYGRPEARNAAVYRTGSA